MRSVIRWNGRKGLEFWEMGLFIFFLAIAGGASIFFFFLSSRDMKAAQARAIWSQKLEGMLDNISRELENAVELKHPFAGPSQECFFRRASLGGSLPPSLAEEGFLFAENELQHVIRTASGTTVPRPLDSIDNPLISGLQAGRFERISSNLLKISFKIPSPGDPENVKFFNRVLYLRNQ